MARQAPWWRGAVIYEVYVRSFADGDGDGVGVGVGVGVGDLPGIRSRLPYLAELGVDAVWLTPFYPSPQADHGYDVADYRGVDPLFGTLGDFDALVTDAHALGLRVVVDIVPNHTSSAHPWFQAALSVGAGSAERARYHFHPGRGPDGSTAPNNWQSLFGGPAWTRVADGEWYLHLFDPAQPDLDWGHPEVGDEFESILRWWLDRGVDGFRIDVAHGLVKAGGLPDLDPSEPHPAWDQPGVHDVYRRWRRLLDSYPGDRMGVVEAWSDHPEQRAKYVRSDEMHQAFNFHFQTSAWSARDFRAVIDESIATTSSVGAVPTWVLSSHDRTRHPTRYGGGAAGLERACAATLLMLALPGSSYLYQGEELGLPQVDIAPEHRQDPTWERSGHTKVGRDGCRVPLPWSGTAPPYGFGPSDGQPWLPQPPDWGAYAVAAQAGVESSTLELYRRALRVRREHLPDADVELGWHESPAGLLAFNRGSVTCVTNFADTAARLPVRGDVVLTSGVALSAGTDGKLELPPRTTVWLVG